MGGEGDPWLRGAKPAPCGALQVGAGAHYADHDRGPQRLHQGLDQPVRDRPQHGRRGDRGRGLQVLQPQRLRHRGDGEGVGTQPAGRAYSRRLDDQPADREERVPVAERRLFPQGAGGLVHRADRACLGQAADHGGIPQRRRDGDRHLWRGGRGAALLRPFGGAALHRGGGPDRGGPARPQEARSGRRQRFHPAARQCDRGPQHGGAPIGIRRLCLRLRLQPKLPVASH